MTIGILTFHRGPNYGGYLQAWHLREAVRRLGHQAEIINYQNPTLRASERPILHNYHPATLRHAYRVWRKCKPFKPLVDSFSPDPFTSDPNQVPWSRFDTVIVGSDVVWDYQTPQFGHDPCYFGTHASQSETRFISYAASCGPARPEAGIPEWVSTGLSRFDSLAVRDESTRALVRQACDREAALVVDPTWLNEDPVPFRSIAPAKPYILVYGNPLNDTRAVELREYARRRGLILVGAASAWKYCDITLNGFDPLQWADLFRKAEAIVTATLHGLLYAIKAGKPLLMVTLPAAANKSHTVLARLNALNRVVTPNDIFSPEKLRLLDPQNPPSPDQTWILESRDYLQKALA
jgi:hypothetical protein